jgi:biotin carboxylase
MRFSGHTVVLVEHPRNWAAYNALERISDHGARLELLTQNPRKYVPLTGFPVDPLSIFDRISVVDTNDIDALTKFVASMHNEPSAILSFSHHYTGIAATVAQRIGLPGPSPEVINQAIHKDQFRNLMKDSPLSLRWTAVLRESQLREVALEFGFPFVMKPPSGTSSTDVTLVWSQEEAAAAFRRIAMQRTNRMGQPLAGIVLVEEYVVGPEFSVEALTANGVTQIYGITEKLPYQGNRFIEQADTFPVSSHIITSALGAAAADALTALDGFSGLSHTEIRYTAAGPKIIEVNPRQGGGHLPTLIEITSGRNVFVDGVSERLGLAVNVDTHAVRNVAATWWQLYSELDGVFREFCYLNLTLPPEVQMLHCYAKPGDVVRAAKDNRDCIGAIIVTGASVEMATSTAKRIAEDVRLRVS